MTIGNKIRALDYNNYRKKISAIYGSGGTNPDTNAADPKWGYGQTLQSSDVDLDKKIGVSEWNKLIYDIANAWQQQNGTSINVIVAAVNALTRGLTKDNKIRSSQITIKDIIAGNICVTELEYNLFTGDVFVPSTTGNGFISGTTYYIKTVISPTQFTVSESEGGTIKILAAQNNVNILGNSSSQPYNYLDSILTQLSDITNRFTASTLVAPPALQQSGSAVKFKNTTTTVVDVTFQNSNEARWFFNSGGELYFTTAFSPSLSNAQNTAWRDFLNTASLTPPKLRGKPSDTINFYNLTETFQTLYQQKNSSSAAYNEKLIWRIDVSTPGVTNNSGGTARVIRFSVVYEDQYVDPPVLNAAGSNNTPAMFPPDDEVNGTITLTVRKRTSTFLKIPAGAGQFQVNGPSNVVIGSFLSS